LKIFICTFRLVATAMILSAVAISFAPAQSTPAHPDFSGAWVLDFARSDSSSFTPKSATWSVVQKGDSIVLDRESPGTGMQHAVYAFDGSPRKFTLRLVGNETEATSTVSWTGPTMVIHTTSRPMDRDLIQTDSWKLSSDGKELRIKREAIYDGGPLGSPTLVFVKK
jgi:hypothetical protein